MTSHALVPYRHHARPTPRLEQVLPRTARLLRRVRRRPAAAVPPPPPPPPLVVVYAGGPADWTRWPEHSLPTLWELFVMDNRELFNAMFSEEVR